MVLFRRRNDDADEEAEQRDAERHDQPFGQYVAHGKAERGAGRPADVGRQDGGEAVPDGKRFRPVDGDREDLIGDALRINEAVPERRAHRNALAQSGAHQNVTCVDDECHDEDGDQAGVLRHQLEAGIFTGRREVQRTVDVPEQGAHADRTGGDAEREGDGEIGERDRDRIF